GWLARIAEVLGAVPLYPVILGVVVPAAILATRSNGRLAVPAAQVAVVGCVAGDVCLLATALAQDAATALVLLAAGGGLARLPIAALAGRRVTRLRAAAS